MYIIKRHWIPRKRTEERVSSKGGRETPTHDSGVNASSDY